MKINNIASPLNHNQTLNSNFDKSTSLNEGSEAKVDNLDDYSIGKQLGQGAYAVVKLAVHKATGRHVAVKVYEKYKLLDPHRKKSVRREIKLLEKISNPHIYKLYETIETTKEINLILEYVSGMSLHGLLKSRPNRRLDEHEVKRIFRQVILALCYCHSKCIAHRDIKLENVLLDDKHDVKLIDFGFSTCIPNDKKMRIFCGTPSYMAPEIVLKKE